jgi:hypothetical protein
VSRCASLWSGTETKSVLQFHDLRHEAISRFFEMGLSVPEVALISGHRDMRMLFRYTHHHYGSCQDRAFTVSAATEVWHTYRVCTASSPELRYYCH